MDSVPPEKLDQVDNKTKIHIRGPVTFQNQLLADHIARGTGLTTTCGPEFRKLCIEDEKKTTRCLLLDDCHNLDTNRIWSNIADDSLHCGDCLSIGLFNISNNLSATIEPVAVERGIRGIFYMDLSPDMIVKGVRAITNGELWYSHKTVSRYFKQNAAQPLAQPNQNTPLTPRQNEILRLLIVGDSNTEIADKLQISIHTVKTHISNIYKKIDVPSRLPAVLRAAKHLTHI